MSAQVSPQLQHSRPLNYAERGTVLVCMTVSTAPVVRAWLHQAGLAGAVSVAASVHEALRVHAHRSADVLVVEQGFADPGAYLGQMRTAGSAVIGVDAGHAASLVRLMGLLLPALLNPAAAVAPVEVAGVELTGRDRQVLAGMADGTTNAQIGRRLHIADDTVKTHAHRLYRKLGARSRAHAIAIAFRRGILR